MTFWQMLSMTNLFKKKTSRLHHHGTVSHSLWFPNWIKCLEAWGWQAGFEKTTAHYYVNKCANSTMLIGSPAKCLYFPWWPLKFFSNIKYLFFFKKRGVLVLLFLLISMCLIISLVDLVSRVFITKDNLPHKVGFMSGFQFLGNRLTS